MTISEIAQQHRGREFKRRVAAVSCKFNGDGALVYATDAVGPDLSVYLLAADDWEFCSEPTAKPTEVWFTPEEKLPLDAEIVWCEWADGKEGIGYAPDSNADYWVRPIERRTPRNLDLHAKPKRWRKR